MELQIWLRTKLKVLGGLVIETVLSVHACREHIENLKKNSHTLLALHTTVIGHIKKSCSGLLAALAVIDSLNFYLVMPVPV